MDRSEDHSADRSDIMVSYSGLERGQQIMCYIQAIRNFPQRADLKACDGTRHSNSQSTGRSLKKKKTKDFKPAPLASPVQQNDHETNSMFGPSSRGRGARPSSGTCGGIKTQAGHHQDAQANTVGIILVHNTI